MIENFACIAKIFLIFREILAQDIGKLRSINVALEAEPTKLAKFS